MTDQAHFGTDGTTPIQQEEVFSMFMSTYPSNYGDPQRREMLSNIQRVWPFWICAHTGSEAVTRVLVTPDWNRDVLKMDYAQLDPAMEGGEERAFILASDFGDKFPVLDIETATIEEMLRGLEENEKRMVHMKMVTCEGLANELKLAGRWRKCT